MHVLECNTLIKRDFIVIHDVCLLPQLDKFKILLPKLLKTVLDLGENVTSIRDEHIVKC